MVERLVSLGALKVRLRTAILSFLLISNGVLAAELEPIRDAIGKAILKNPEVLAKWHSFKAAVDEKDVSSGAYLPSVDLQSSLGRERRSTPIIQTNTYNQANASLVLRQVVFDGFAVRNDVKRLDHVSRVRYFELMDASEFAALEAIRAYQDVVRYRKLVQLAESNYATHRVVHDQIKERAQAGVGRKVDLELAAGRLALAETNLLVELPNLHDVSARYQRIVGEAPPSYLPEVPSLVSGIPATPKEALGLAFGKSPQLWATVENVMAAQSDKDVRNAAFIPRVDFEARGDLGRNLQGYIGDHKTASANLLLNWNLFRGGSDKARVNMYGEQVNVAMDLRDKACRDVRQTVLIAMNDVARINEKLAYLDQHQLSIEKARDAFRQQFNIGQRTLLDTLDIENEYFEARRAYVNGEADLNIAHSRVFAAAGTLLTTIKMDPLEPSQPDDSVMSNEEAMARCPAEAPEVMAVDKEKAFANALATTRQRLAQQPAAALPVMTATTPVNLDGANFDVRSAALLSQAIPRLETVLKYASANPDANLVISGHTDKRAGSKALYNMKLSERRADAVKAYLVANGVSRERIETKAYGFDNPIADNSTEAGRAQNRRVEIRSVPRK